MHGECTVDNQRSQHFKGKNSIPLEELNGFKKGIVNVQYIMKVNVKN